MIWLARTMKVIYIMYICIQLKLSLCKKYSLRLQQTRTRDIKFSHYRNRVEKETPYEHPDQIMAWHVPFAFRIFHSPVTAYQRYSTMTGCVLNNFNNIHRFFLSSRFHFFSEWEIRIVWSREWNKKIYRLHRIYCKFFCDKVSRTSGKC